jgi:oligopeptide transport system substrate-binding protein
MQLFLAGNLDIIDLTGDQVDQYQEDPRTRVYPSRVVTHMDINAGNTANPILKNMNFRRAMYWAMDRNTFAKLTKQMAAPTYIHHTAGGYPDDNILYRDLPEAKALVNPNGGYDPVKAKNYFNAALAETGIKGKVTVNLMYSDASAETKIIGEYMQKQLPIIFGADKFALTLTSSPSASFSATKRNWVNNPNAYQMAFGSWSNSSTLIYPNTQFRYFASSYSSGSAPYNNAKFDQLFNQSLTEEYRLDQKKTVAATIEMEKIFLNEVLAVPVYEAVSRTMFAPRVKLPLKDYVPSVGWGYMYSDIDLTK